MQRFNIEFKDNSKFNANLHLEAYKFNDCFHVEIWDVTTPYNDFQPFENEKQEYLKSFTERVKSLQKNNADEYQPTILELKRLISELNKFKNKRYKLSEKEFFENYQIKN